MKHHCLIAVFAVVLTLGACSRSPFARAHDQAVAQNPAGIELQIRTVNGSNKLRLGEPVRFEELYTSKYSGWHIEVLDGMNEASVADEVFVTDGKTTWTPSRPPRVFVCCDSRHVRLGLDPARLPYRYAQTADGFKPVGDRSAVLPNQPGRYQMYVTTHRVFSRGYSMTTNHGKGTAVTSSNILTLEVVK